MSVVLQLGVPALAALLISGGVGLAAWLWQCYYEDNH